VKLLLDSCVWLEGIEQFLTTDGPDDNRSDEWLAEVKRRAERVRRGEVHGKPWPHVRDELLARLRERRP
jgi:hypothetical protein